MSDETTDRPIIFTENYGAYPRPDGSYSIWVLAASADEDGPPIRGSFINNAKSFDHARGWISNLQAAYDTPGADVAGKSEAQLQAEERMLEERDPRKGTRRRRNRGDA